MRLFLRVVGWTLPFGVLGVSACTQDSGGDAIPPTGASETVCAGERITITSDEIEGEYTNDLQRLSVNYRPARSEYVALTFEGNANDVVYVTAESRTNGRTPMMWLVYEPDEVRAHEALRGANRGKATLSRTLKKGGRYYIAIRDVDAVEATFDVTLRRIAASDEAAAREDETCD